MTSARVIHHPTSKGDQVLVMDLFEVWEEAGPQSAALGRFGGEINPK